MMRRYEVNRINLRAALLWWLGQDLEGHYYQEIRSICVGLLGEDLDYSRLDPVGGPQRRLLSDELRVMQILGLVRVVSGSFATRYVLTQRGVAAAGEVAAKPPLELYRLPPEPEQLKLL